MLFTCLLPASVTLSTPQDLDFWVGDWKMASHSRNSYDSDAFSEGTATNKVVRNWEGKVIEEDFHSQGFNGRSWSVFNPKTKRWSQTWVDDSGAYMLFEGGKVADKVILSSTQGSPAKRQRMVFSKITPKSFTWEWEESRDGGKGWKLMWELKYERIS
ncbi:hypothetical protein BH11ARM2_BH11ARM2_19430 [soil metagenome]